MYHDDQAYDKSHDIGMAWIPRLRQKILPTVVETVAKALRTEAKVEFQLLSIGSFNCCYRVQGFDSIVRFPILCQSAFRFEKTIDECEIMEYISRNTSISIPKLAGSACSDEGPYMVMSFVDGTQLSKFLQAPSDNNAPIVLNPNIDLKILATAYRNMARVLIGLSRCKFTQIGAVGRDESGRWCVKKRPVTLNMNELVSCGNYPPNMLPQRAFLTANDYFTTLAEIHITHLRTQRNNAVDNEADCQKKYVARQLFLKIARKFSNAYNRGPFPLYCDDLRPSNVIVDSDLNLQSVIDWEYCYAAPAELTYCSPWWLLLKRPDSLKEGEFESFLAEYHPRHHLFLEVLREEEDKSIQQGTIFECQRLSTPMAASLDNGHFWFCLAATSSYGFDDIYWKFVDPLYYGPFTSIEDRIRLLSQQAQDDLESLVQLKMQQSKEGDLDEHWSLHQMITA